jgi:predicted Zn-dependent protease with MMP-like domain
MDWERFEAIAEEEFAGLPEVFHERLENVIIVVEDCPSPETIRKMGLGPGSMLLGLYEGVPLNKRGTWYGSYPVTPDRITLFKDNIEYRAGSEKQIRKVIRDTIIHEIAHHFGMSEEEVRAAGY